jgi:cbb3-type cytochrome oxidase subunit 3
MLEVLTGMGLSASAGLNAYIPLLAVGLLGRFTGLIDLPTSWNWLSNGWVLSILAVLLAVEVVADKIPVLDSFNDMLHTVIRPTAGGLAFGASSESQTVTVSDPGSFFATHQWVPIAAGAGIALGVHGVKAAARPVINVSTFGFGAPIVSTIEDIFSTVMSVIAIVLPFLIIFFLAGIVWFFAWVRRKRSRRRAERAALRATVP